MYEISTGVLPAAEAVDRDSTCDYQTQGNGEGYKVSQHLDFFSPPPRFHPAMAHGGLWEEEALEVPNEQPLVIENTVRGPALLLE